MRIRQSDLTVFVFVLAVLLSGMWLAEQFGMEWSPTLLVVVGAVAGVWTIYYRFSVAPRLGSKEGEEQSAAADRSTGSSATNPGDET